MQDMLFSAHHKEQRKTICNEFNPNFSVRENLLNLDSGLQ